MDAELAESVVDDAFEGLGTPECLYEPPGGGSSVEGLVLILHRPSTERARSNGVRFERGEFHTDAQPAAIISLRRQVEPEEGGVFVIAGGRWKIGEAPVDDDAFGFSQRSSVVKL